MAIVQEDKPKRPATLLYREGGYYVGAINFDLILSENHTFENDVTTHPIESGVPITDHIQNKLRSGSLTGLITNFSLSTKVGLPTDVSLKLKSGVGVSIDLLNNLDTATNRVSDAYTACKSLWQSRSLIDIATTLEVYTNVAIESIEISRNGDDGAAQEFEISFIEVKQVKLQEKKKGTELKGIGTTNDTKRQANQDSDIGRTVSPNSSRGVA